MDIEFDGYIYTVDFSNRIGRGGYGSVYPGHLKDDPEFQIIVKHFYYDSADPESTYMNWSDEISAVLLLGTDFPRCSPYFVCYIGSTVLQNNNEPVYLIAYKRAWGDMVSFSDKFRTHINSETKFVFVQSMLMSLIELRKRGLAHRDIKAENILVFRDRHEWGFALADLGALCSTRESTRLSCNISSENKTTITSLPPVIRSKSRSHSDDPVLNGYLESGVEDTGYRSEDDMMWADIYAMGCVIYTFLTGERICLGILRDVRPIQMEDISFTDEEGYKQTINGALLSEMLTRMIYSRSYEEASTYEDVDIFESPVFVGGSRVIRTIGRTFQRAGKYRIQRR